MAKFRITAPDGATYEITAPDGASEQEVLSYAQQNFSKPTQPKTAEDLRRVAKERGEVSNPVAETGFFENAAAGVGKAIKDSGRGLKQLASYAVPGMDPKAVTAEIAESRNLDRPLMDTGGGLTGNIAGNVGMALAPGGVLKGAAAAAKGIPALASAAPAISAAGGALLAPKSIPAALAVGGGMGLIQPVENAQERVTNALLGAGLTAAVPAAGKVLKGAKAAVEPFYEAGQDQIVGRALRSAAGPQADDAMRAMAGARELVPGSAPTAGQVAENPGIAAMERAAKAVNPTVMNAYAGREAAQNQARTALLERLAGRDGGLATALAKREGQAGALYGAARSQPIAPQSLDAAKPLLDNLTERMPSGVMEKAKELARVAGESFDPQSVQGMHWIKKGVDDLISGGRTSGMGKESTRALMQFQGDLLSVMDDLSPAYKEARQQFVRQSKPINQMQIVDALLSKSTRPLDGQIMPGQFARNLSDRTAQTATGFRGATLKNTLSPRQLEQLNAVRDDVASAVFAQNAGRGVGSDTVQKLAMSNIVDQAGVPTFLRDLAPMQATGRILARGSDAIYGGANKEIAERLAMGLLDPKEAARMMASATPSQRAQIAELLAQRALAPLGMSAPAMLNANQ